MNRGPFIFFGVLVIISVSWALTLVKPIDEGGQLAAEVAGDIRKPGVLTGLAAQGRDVYQAEGCVVCHTQQIRVTSGNDTARGWGDRQTIALDYIDQSPVFTGSSRIGPDLTNVGARRSELEWHLLHFYNPQITVDGSTMPSYAYLFETREIEGQGSSRALNLPSEFAADEGFEVVPTRKAEALAAYMMNLNIEYDIEEAPSIEKLNYEVSE